MRRVGFEGKLLWGVAGSTAATELKIAIDVSYKFEPTKADVSDRESIIDYDKVAGIKFSLEFNTNNDDSNAFVAAAERPRPRAPDRLPHPRQSGRLGLRRRLLDLAR
jgi:hypothetical protein